MHDHTLPHVGLRMVKSAVAVLICLLVSMLVNQEDIRIYSSIAALLCVQPYVEDTKRMALQRIIGTFLGSAAGALAILIEVYLLDIRGTLIGYVLIAALILPTLWGAVALKAANAASLSCVVLLSITVTHITDANPWIFVWNRVVETLLGIAVGIGVNAFQLPRRKRRDILFVSGLDGVLLEPGGQTLAPASRVRLNRMLDDGLLFTISTVRTPASVREAAQGLRLRLPVIVMDGAAMFDLGKKTFLHTRLLPQELAMECCQIFEEQGIHCFLNGVQDDVLLIYYGELRNEAERDVYEKCRTSPYRNYISRDYFQECPVLYLMGVDRTERIQALYDALRAAGLVEQVKVRLDPAPEYPGFSYLKVYEKSASRQAMLELLKADLKVDKSVMLSSLPDQGDVLVQGGAQAVKVLERMFEPLLWQRKKNSL